jgi:2-methylcitrate dehydratase PrpD
MLIYPDPQTGLEGKFSLEFCLALALTDRVVKLEGFTDSKVKDPQIQNLIKRISKEVTKEADSSGTYYPKARIDVKMKDGKAYSCTIEKRKGSPANPLTVQEVKEKFLDCASQATSGEHAERVADLVMGMDHINDIGRLIKVIVKK